MPLRVDVPFFAPIPVGHHVTVYALELFATPLFGPASQGHWEPSKQLVVCDDKTRIVYGNWSVIDGASMPEQLVFHEGRFRVSTQIAPLRGTVTSCVAIADDGDHVVMKTVLGVEPDGGAYR